MFTIDHNPSDRQSLAGISSSKIICGNCELIRAINSWQERFETIFRGHLQYILEVLLYFFSEFGPAIEAGHDFHTGIGNTKRVFKLCREATILRHSGPFVGKDF